MATEYESRERNSERRRNSIANIAVATLIIAAILSNVNRSQESEGQDVSVFPGQIQILRTGDPSIRPVVLNVSNPIIIPRSPGQESRYRFFHKGAWTEVSPYEVRILNFRPPIISSGDIIKDLDAAISSAKMGRHPGELIKDGKKITMSVSEEPDNVY